MWANRVFNFLTGVLAFVILPIQIVTTLVLGLAVSLTFGLLLIPISLVWMVLLALMLGLSFAGSRVPALRNAIGILFVPVAVVAYVFVCLMPSMGELENRAAKMLYCGAWPFTWEFWELSKSRGDPNSKAWDQLFTVMSKATYRNPIAQRTFDKIIAREPLDAPPHMPSGDSTDSGGEEP